MKVLKRVKMAKMLKPNEFYYVKFNKDKSFLVYASAPQITIVLGVVSHPNGKIYGLENLPLVDFTLNFITINHKLDLVPNNLSKLVQKLIKTQINKGNYGEFIEQLLKKNKVLPKTVVTLEDLIKGKLNE